MIWLQRRTLIMNCFVVLFSSTNQPSFPAFLLLTLASLSPWKPVLVPWLVLILRDTFLSCQRPTQISGARTRVMGVLWLPMEVIRIYQRIYKRGKPHVFGWPRNFPCSFIFSGKTSSLLYGWFRFSDLQYLPGTCGSHCQPQWQLKGSGGLCSPWAVSGPSSTKLLWEAGPPPNHHPMLSIKGKLKLQFGQAYCRAILMSRR